MPRMRHSFAAPRPLDYSYNGASIFCHQPDRRFVKGRDITTGTGHAYSYATRYETWDPWLKYILSTKATRAWSKMPSFMTIPSSCRTLCGGSWFNYYICNAGLYKISLLYLILSGSREIFKAFSLFPFFFILPHCCWDTRRP